MTWWIWVLLGFALLAIEAATQMIGIGFFGIGAILVGFLVAIGLGGPLWMQWLMFTVVSLLSLVVFRQPLVRRLRGDHAAVIVDSLHGETAVAMEEIGKDQVGKAELRGAPWNARNIGDGPIGRGQRCQVERVEGLLLFIRG
jgi:membrane protein implicated in regulation of membrane protease activity